MSAKKNAALSRLTQAARIDKRLQVPSSDRKVQATASEAGAAGATQNEINQAYRAGRR
ncbi:hypothetical protein [Streptomyces sp. NBC_01197]|uniref:hypothetical protein n=1 Tax=Streptomyces sp. NBC_01197 TaxID=2903768 RepID=UPI002E1620C1|nr:hypothetical protein OG452_20995 [Streptomyces sp. NBC_01197]